MYGNGGLLYELWTSTNGLWSCHSVHFHLSNTSMVLWMLSCQDSVLWHLKDTHILVREDGGWLRWRREWRWGFGKEEWALDWALEWAARDWTGEKEIKGLSKSEVCGNHSTPDREWFKGAKLRQVKEQKKMQIEPDRQILWEEDVRKGAFIKEDILKEEGVCREKVNNKFI